MCQYDLTRPAGHPGLLAARTQSGDAAASLLEAVQQAPPGGGPDQPKNCLEDGQGDTAVVLRLNGPGSG